MKTAQKTTNTNELMTTNTIEPSIKMTTNTIESTEKSSSNLLNAIDTRIIGSQLIAKNETLAEKVKQTQSGIIIKPKNLTATYPQLEKFKYPLIKLVAVKDKIVKINPCLFGGDVPTLVFPSIDDIHVTDFKLIKYSFNFAENDSYAVVSVDDVQLMVSVAVNPSTKELIEDGEIASEGTEIDANWFKSPPVRTILAKSLPINEKFKVSSIHEITKSEYGGKTVNLKNLTTGETIKNVVLNRELTRLANTYNTELTFTIKKVEKVLEKVTRNKKTTKEEKVYLTIDCHNEKLEMKGI